MSLRSYSPIRVSLTKSLLYKLIGRDLLSLYNFWPKQALNAEETAAYLYSHVLGQREICEDIAQILQHKATQNNSRNPLGIFLLTGSDPSCKILLAKCLGHLFNWPLIEINTNAHMTINFDRSTQHSNTNISLNNPSNFSEAIILIHAADQGDPYQNISFLQSNHKTKELHYKPPPSLSIKRSLFLVILNEDIPFQKNFHFLNEETSQILQQKGLSSSFINCIDRIYTFQPLQNKNLGQIFVPDIEQLVKNYGLNIAPPGISPFPILALINNQTKVFKDKKTFINFVETMISDSLIKIKQQGAKTIRLVYKDNLLIAEPAEQKTI